MAFTILKNAFSTKFGTLHNPMPRQHPEISKIPYQNQPVYAVPVQGFPFKKAQNLS
jgi:hypothetical protein